MFSNKTNPYRQKPAILSGEQGSTMVVMLIILSVLGTIAAGAMSAINLNLQAADSHRKGNRGYYAAETALDIGAGRILLTFENLSEYTDSTEFGGGPDGWVDITMANDGIDEINGYSLEYRVVQQSARFFYQTQSGPNVLSHFAYEFVITGRAQQIGGTSTETLQETIRVLQTPLVQYFLFFGGTGEGADLELNSGPPQNSWGRVHTNGNLYYGAQTNFNFRDYDLNNQPSPHSWTVSGDAIHSWKPNSRISGGLNPILFKTASNGSFDMNPSTNISSTYNASNSSHKTTLQGTYNGFIEIGVPIKRAPGRTQFVRNGFYEQRAGDPERNDVYGISIVGQGLLAADGSGIQVFVSEPAPNTDVTALIANGQSSAGNPIANFMTPVLNSPGAFWDCREGDQVNATDIDLFALGTWYQAYLDDLGQAMPQTGFLVYTSRSPNDTFANNTANVLEAIRFRVISGASGSLPGVLGNTTVATDNPYYVQGNFNTNAPRFGVAIVGDAYNVLSNAWDNSKVCDGTRSPLPNQTTHNLAAFAGIVPTGGSVFSGAFINYPRMHECWDAGPCGQAANTPLNINGALINLWVSSQGTSPWNLSGHFYNAPQRNYGWDINFDNPNFWPPFVPAIYSMERDSFVE